ncbi:hypothetical protein [Sinomonas sp. ASV322]|uniref:hypothetical protein n=1 Tax=Sinomonas sp. ASV322 TaxID=3041920 RepID=UPI0027DE0959|nr:hypothetical protein [Sinomonas sp. ASV322]MDQ4502941.1 hypothetical protein [Sinomonas sp. ASV322]
MEPNITKAELDTSARRRIARRWTVGAASTLAAVLLAGGGTALALETRDAQPQTTVAGASDTAGSEDSLDTLTSLDDLGTDVGAGGSTAVTTGSAVVAPAAFIAPVASTPSPSPSATGKAAAKHPARASLRHLLAVIIRGDGDDEKYGDHSQTAAREFILRHSAAFRHLPEKLRQDLWTLAGATEDHEVADAHTIKDRALDGSYGTAIKKLAEAIKDMPAKPKANTPAPGATSGS